MRYKLQVVSIVLISASVAVHSRVFTALFVLVFCVLDSFIQNVENLKIFANLANLGVELHKLINEFSNKLLQKLGCE